MVNIIPHDIRSYFPSNDILPSPDMVAKDAESQRYLAKTEEVYKLNLISSKQVIQDLRTALSSKDPDLLGVTWASLGGIYTFNGNYQYAFTAFNNAFDNQVNNDVRAFIYTEVSNLMRKLGYSLDAITLLESAYEITKNKQLKYRINTYLGICYSNRDPEYALSLLKNSEKYYAAVDDRVRLVTVLRHMGSIYISKKDYKKANRFIKSAKAIAMENGLTNHMYSCINDMGWMYIAKGEANKAKKLYLDLLEKDLIPYSRALALQNLGYLEYEQKNYQNCIAYHTQSMRITKDHQMRDMLFEDFYKIGKSYEHLNQPGMADYFYLEGYRELQKELELGLRILGYRKLLLDSYVRFLQSNQKNPNINRNDRIFSFAKDKSFGEIRKFFQRSLLLKHHEHYPTANSLCQNLGMNTRTYFNYQAKLDIKRGQETVEDLDPYFNQYLEELLQLKWKDANQRFEADLYDYLLKKFQYNKKRLAEALNVSYAQVIQKTKPLGDLN